MPPAAVRTIKISRRGRRTFPGWGMCFFATRIGPLDVLAFIEERKTYEDLLDHTIEIEFRGRDITVLDIKMLIELKRKPKILRISSGFLSLKKHCDNWRRSRS
jgi:hypothetical protein